MEQFDYVVVGAGSAGCVLAERLSASGKHRVLVVESGPKDRSPWIHMPVGYGKLFYHQRLNYGFQTEPQPHLNNRADYYPRGHVVGGSGAINAMVYCRGLPNDFDDWAAQGATGWAWSDVAQTFDRIETQVAPDGTTTGSGPIHVSDVRDQIHPINRHYFDAVSQCQLPHSDNINDPNSEGSAVYRINTKSGRRWSAAQAFLAPALRRKNLELRTGAQVQRVIISEGRATGIKLDWKGKTHTIRAGEVILSAGALHSPAILQRSGIGPGDVLARHGITQVLDNPNVGAHLQDHVGINYFFKSHEPSLNNQLAPWYGKLMAGLRYALTRKGPLALSVNQCGGFFRSSPVQPVPDQQIYFNPVTYTTTKSGTRTVINPDPFSGFIIGFQPCRPTSRGFMEITGTRHQDAPRVQPNSMATPEDQKSVIDGGRLCARIMQAPALTALVKEPIYSDIRTMDDDALLSDFKDRSGTVFHTASTCRMGRDAQTSVTDPNLRVHGIRNLRVVDASVFPNVTSGNINAPTMMLAYRAADLIANTGP
jgi:choline dehydrogenase